MNEFGNYREKEVRKDLLVGKYDVVLAFVWDLFTGFLKLNNKI